MNTLSVAELENIALRAVDHAFTEGVAKLYEVLVQGLETTNSTGLALELPVKHFVSGFACHCNAHDKATTAITNYFKELKS
jgi:hypothetical protein